MTEPIGELLVYADPGGQVRLQVRLHEGSVWLSQAGMAELYGTTPQNITQHIRAIYAEGEQDAGATCKQYLQVRREGSREVRREIRHERHAGRVSAEAARQHAESEFERWRASRRALPEPVDADFEAAVEATKQIEARRPLRPRKAIR